MKNKTDTLEWWDKAHTEASNLAKWIALYEAVNMVADKAQEKGIPADEIVYKPKPIREYITATEDIILKKILQEDYNIEICYSDESSNKEFEYEVY